MAAELKKIKVDYHGFKFLCEFNYESGGYNSFEKEFYPANYEMEDIYLESKNVYTTIYSFLSQTTINELEQICLTECENE